MNRNRTNPKNKAFTLVELMVVILIIGILAAMIVPRIISRTEDANNAKALADLRNLSKMLDTYRLDVGNYPTADLGLEALRQSDEPGWRGPYTQNPIPLDPWENEYVYDWPGPDGDDSYFLYSLGRDGTESEDDIIESGE